ncbi:hypothetical protein BsWGS_15041 [Bradybaena similaris]
MRLKCEVQVTNRLLPALNIRKPARTTYTQVSIGKNPGSNSGQLFLMLCTAQNRSGTKYLLHRNVDKIFEKFIHEGKVTIRMLKPDDDIALSKADPKELLSFIKLVKLTCKGNDVPAHSLSTLVPASSQEVAKPVTCLQVYKPSEYPMSFPKSLEQLTIQNCSLRRINPQITALPELRTLDMSYNNITSVPDSLGQLASVHTLNLSYNKLTTFPAILCNSRISNTLVTLNLSNNEIASMPYNIDVLKSLHSLDISHNQLRLIPETLGFLKNLRKLYAAYNQLEFFPGTMVSNVYHIFEFNDNRLPNVVNRPVKVNCFPMSTLKELAARRIVSLRIPYSNEDLDCDSIDYLKTVHYCFCGKPCFEAMVSQLDIVRVLWSSDFLYNQIHTTFLINFCSRTCNARYRS